MQAFIKDLFNFKGRANRAKYISTMFYLLALYFVLGFLALVIVSFSSYEKGAVTVVLEAIMTTMFFICIASLVAASLCNSIRRCHDLNLPGWVAFIFFFSSFAPGLLFPTSSPLTFIVCIPLLYLLFAKGTEGPNEYGEDPLQKE
mgnify:FL=1